MKRSQIIDMINTAKRDNRNEEIERHGKTINYSSMFKSKVKYNRNHERQHLHSILMTK